MLEPDEAERYERIFELQEGGHWAAADREIDALQDKLLLGHVLAQRYLHRHYRTSYAELARWLARYADLPEAKALYSLARKRHPRGAPAPAKPATAALTVAGPGGDIGPRALDLPDAPDARGLTPAEQQRAATLRGEIRELARREPHRAEARLADGDAQRLLTGDERDELRTDIAESYLAAGKVHRALAVSVANEGAAYAPVAHWNAGLAAWRLGRLSEARRHFQAVARSPGQSGWTTAAAAFWAGRVELRSRHPERVAHWLDIAAKHPRTFYGLLARRLLGVDTYFDFDADPFTEIDAQIIDGTEAGRRALALIEVGQRTLAAAELRALAAQGSSALVQSLAALADRANLPSVSLQLAALLAGNDGHRHDHGLYPVPRWVPRGGFTVDRALLFALMRQESQFLPHVESTAGALGLMQLMPATARAMADRAGIEIEGHGRRHERAALIDPELNLTLAQEYVATLLGNPRIDGNLLLAACAYNAGLGAALRWQAAQPEYKKDPLLFLESIPSHQARVFTARVLTNYWIYRLRLGQPTPDLDALAAGEWPTYTAFDSLPEQDGRHAANR